MKLTKAKAKAKELSLKKWEYIVGNNGSPDGLTKVYPELEKLEAHCGYCEKYSLCCICPLYSKEGKYGCGHELHLWTKWSIRKTKSNAQKVLDLIRES